MTRRCTKCNYSQRYELPPLNKKIIYLDQNAISNIFKINSSKMNLNSNRESFWRKVSELSRKIFLLQQAVFPLSDIHRDETIVYVHADELNLAHEMLGGDVSFISSDRIMRDQTLEFIDKYLNDEGPPQIDFSAENALEGNKDHWISDLHITTSMDFSIFATEVRSERDSLKPAYENLLKLWAEQRPSFQQALRVELEGYGIENKKAVQSIARELASAIERGNFNEAVKATSKRTYREFQILREHIEQSGVPKNESCEKVFSFWAWKGNQELPHNKISSYLFAALARRISQGQLKTPTVGIFNDFKSISTYAPYVDAIFLDNECANILNESPTKGELNLSSRVFSTKSGEEYIQYLEEIESSTPETVRNWATEIYGLD